MDGAANGVISSAYGYLALQSNGSNKWTVTGAATFNGSAGIFAPHEFRSPGRRDRGPHYLFRGIIGLNDPNS